MILIRLDSKPNPKPDEYPDDHRQVEYGVEQITDSLPEASRVKVAFPRFGRGEQKRSDFAVEMNWVDVQGYVREFIEMGHPDALHLQRLIRLAEKIENAGWFPDDPPTEDFWDIVPPNSN
ncbi:hypothetical protein KMZ29_07350 [Bradyrhizobium sediminis]|uniref:Uncharacterized protein n=1 Tax=Bradyrhizobium sediminis TaxID=2840469 RepID=A0A975RPD1_9BRAD|nr:hypothetical protein [Bradyrhizobium sediminis]QWG14476.1 hypothetical protein KMZ29_07350 [Bradyrhizobium sediminis]